ncbi:hypothetical protein [Pseudochelatococcus sp. G4_1912]|uniref:hypothetical protein n=1 Tax=Pseudochelatococcus sp. G4_1912 TaxID=3114288 RepID=UPI0039C5C8B5
MNRRTDHTQQTWSFSALNANTGDSEWLLQMQQLSNQLQQLHASPLLAYDVVAQSIFRDIALAADMEEISRQCDLLLARIHELMQESASSRFVESTSARGPRVMMKL